MRYRGRCPRCGAALASPVVPAAAATCAACGGGLLVTAPEDEPADPAREVELVVMPRPDERPGWLEAHGLRRPLRWLVAGAGLAVLALFLLGLLLLVAPDSDVVEALGRALALALVVALLALPLLALAAGVVGLAFRRERRSPGFGLLRSTLAVAAGAGSALALIVGLQQAGTLLPGSDGAAPALRWGLAVGASLGVGLGAGWITARLAPLLPYRHAACVALVLAGGLAAWMLAVGASWRAAYALVYLAYLPPLLLGAWLHQRRSRARTCPA